MNIPATREYKMGVIGLQGVGKTSLCLQFVRNYFPVPSRVILSETSHIRQRVHAT